MPELAKVAAEEPGSQPIRICVLGSEAAGKTCFLGGLAILSEPNRDSPIHVIGAEADTESTNGSPSQQFLNEVARTLRAGDWPPPTTLTREIELDIRFRDRLFKFDVIDYPGESFREALNQLDESRQQVLLDHMIKADFLLLMLDPDSDLPDLTNLDSEQRQHVHERQNAHVAGIRKIYDDAQITQRALPHIGLVITKADAHPGLTDPAEFIRRRGANLLSRIKSWGVETRCFATSAVGAVTDGRPAEKLMPEGYTQIFDWVVKTTQSKGVKKITRRYLIPAAIVLFGCALALFLQGNHAKQQTADTSKPLDARIEAANGAIISSAGLRKSIDALAADQLGNMRERFSNLRSTEELEQLTSDFQLLKTLRRTSRSHEITEFGNVLAEGDRKLRLLRINSMDPADPELLALAQAFINDYPAAEEAGTVANIIDRIRNLNDATDREMVRRVTVQKGDIDSLNRKADAIMEYVLKHRSSKESELMEQAAAVARRLAATNPLKIRITGAGTFLKARKWELRAFVDDMDRPLAELPTDGKVKRATWDRSISITNWKPGSKVRLEIEEFRLMNEMVAEIEATDMLSIRTLAQNSLIPIRDDFGSEYIEGGYFRVVTELEDFSREDWKLLQLYVYPGKKW